MHELGREPANWDEFFDFLRYMRAKGVLKEMAMAMARAGVGDGK